MINTVEGYDKHVEGYDQQCVTNLSKQKIEWNCLYAHIQYNTKFKILPGYLDQTVMFSSMNAFFVAALKEETQKITKRVPKGTSEYQAAWIVDSGDENDEDDEDDSVCVEIMLLF